MTGHPTARVETGSGDIDLEGFGDDTRLSEHTFEVGGDDGTDDRVTITTGSGDVGLERRQRVPT